MSGALLHTNRLLQANHRQQEIHNHCTSQPRRTYWFPPEKEKWIGVAARCTDGILQGLLVYFEVRWEASRWGHQHSLVSIQLLYHILASISPTCPHTPCFNPTLNYHNYFNFVWKQEMKLPLVCMCATFGIDGLYTQLESNKWATVDIYSLITCKWLLLLLPAQCVTVCMQECGARWCS